LRWLSEEPRDKPRALYTTEVNRSKMIMLLHEWLHLEFSAHIKKFCIWNFFCKNCPEKIEF